MSVKQPVARPAVLLNLPDSVDHRRQIAEAVNRLTQGHANVTLFVTLDPNVAQTVVTDSRISPQTGMVFQPTTANAAAAVATTYAVCTEGSATIFHASNAQIDRVFTIVMMG
jgi:hypothetical protein